MKRLNERQTSGRAIATLFLGLCVWTAAVFAIGQFYGPVDVASDRLVRGSLDRYAAKGDADLGGFMLVFEERIHRAAVLSIAPELSSRADVGYVSQFELPYQIEKALVTLVGSVPRGIVASEILLIFLFSGSLLLLGMAVWREFGTSQAAIVLLCYLLSFKLLRFAGDLYWATALMIAPFCVMWYFYPALRRRSPAAVAGAAFALIFLRALCGYEFITTIILGMAVPIVFYEARAGLAEPRARLGRHAVRLALPVVAGGLGLVAAMALHVAKAAEYFGSWRQGVAALIVPLTYSSVAGDQFRAALTLDAVARAIKDYLEQTIYFPGFNLATALLLIACVLAAVWRLRSFAPDNRGGRFAVDERALGLAALLSVIAPLSWWLMIKHNVVHTHINWMLYALFMVPMLALLAAHLAVRTVRRLSPHRAAQGAAAIPPAVVGRTA